MPKFKETGELEVEDRERRPHFFYFLLGSTGKIIFIKENLSGVCKSREVLSTI
jgi:hypothetical protein